MSVHCSIFGCFNYDIELMKSGDALCTYHRKSFATELPVKEVAEHNCFSWGSVILYMVLGGALTELGSWLIK